MFIYVGSISHSMFSSAGSANSLNPYVLYHAHAVLSAAIRLFSFSNSIANQNTTSRPSADFAYQPELQFKAALTSSAVAAIVGSNQVRIAKVMGLYAIAAHNGCVEDRDDRPGCDARRLRHAGCIEGPWRSGCAAAARAGALAGAPAGALSPGGAGGYRHP